MVLPTTTNAVRLASSEPPPRRPPKFLGELRGVGCDLYLHQQGVDTTTPAGRALFQMLGVFAEFERAIIVERVKAGIARAKAQGKHCGRPFVDGTTEQAIRAALPTGRGISAA